MKSRSRLQIWFIIEHIKKDVVKLYSFEDKIILKVEKAAKSILVATVIKNGIKDHLFYVVDAELFLQTISKYKNHRSCSNAGKIKNIANITHQSIW